MRQGKVYYKDLLAGIITETDEGEYIFEYVPQYIIEHPNDFITFTMPVREEKYRNERLFAFFEDLKTETSTTFLANKTPKI